MKYYRAEKTLPAALLAELRKYVPEGLVYVRPAIRTRRGWGELSGERARLNARNAEIRARWLNAETVGDLADAYHLSVDTIKRIVYSK